MALRTTGNRSAGQSSRWGPSDRHRGRRPRISHRHSLYGAARKGMAHATHPSGVTSRCRLSGPNWVSLDTGRETPAVAPRVGRPGIGAPGIGAPVFRPASRPQAAKLPSPCSSIAGTPYGDGEVHAPEGLVASRHPRRAQRHAGDGMWEFHSPTGSDAGLKTGAPGLGGTAPSPLCAAPRGRWHVGVSLPCGERCRSEDRRSWRHFKPVSVRRWRTGESRRDSLSRGARRHGLPPPRSGSRRVSAGADPTR